MKDPISYDQFALLDIRVGTILACSAPEWSKKLLRFEVDFGSEIGKRVIFSGIKKWYSPDEFVGKQFPFLINLAPKRMGEEESQGMMLMMDPADGNTDDQEQPILFAVPTHVAEGSMVR